MRQPRVLTALVLLTISVLVVVIMILVQTHGQFALPSDASYVNCAVARNFIFYHHWGLSKYEFLPAASSLLYPILLGLLFFVPGAHLLIPVLLNLVVAGWFLLELFGWMRRHLWSPQRQNWLFLLAIGILPVLVLNGTEFVLYLLLAFRFLSACFDYWREERELSNLAFLYALLLVTTRYEGLLLVLAGALLLFRNKRVLAVGLLLAGLTPVLVFGIVCVRHHFSFMPMAMIKIPDGQAWWLAQASVLLIVMVFWPVRDYRWVAGLLLPLALTGVVFLFRASSDALQVYQPQYQAANFLRRYFYRWPLASDELGVISYFTLGLKVNLQDPHLTDSAMRKNLVWVAVSTEDREDYSGRFRWNKIARWKSGDKALSFYAMDTASTRFLTQDLKEYQTFLPKAIHIEYY